MAGVLILCVPIGDRTVVICFSAPPDVRRHLEDLVATGDYTDFSDVLSTAVRNLAVLHADLADRRAIVVDGERVVSKVEPGSRHATRRSATRPQHKRKGATPPIPTSSVSKVAPPPADVAKPALLERMDFHPQAEHIAPFPDDLWGPTQQVPVDRWLFGQYNRLLPAKAAIRALANIVRTEGPVDPEGVTARIAEDAALLGERLRLKDERAMRSRDEALMTAFPAIGPGSAKSLLRFASQFVVSTNSNGQLSGLPADLKLLNRIRGRHSPISLTEAGWRLAYLVNPAIDGAGDTRFSDEETEFLLSHIAHSVPAEAFAYRTLIAAIESGSHTPERLDEALEPLRSTNRPKEPTKSFLMSQRSGAISRMSDLGLIARKRDGVRVEYVVTEAAKAFVSLANTKN